MQFSNAINEIDRSKLFSGSKKENQEGDQEEREEEKERASAVATAAILCDEAEAKSETRKRGNKSDQGTMRSIVPASRECVNDDDSYCYSSSTVDDFSNTSLKQSLLGSPYFAIPKSDQEKGNNILHSIAI